MLNRTMRRWPAVLLIALISMLLSLCTASSEPVSKDAIIGTWKIKTLSSVDKPEYDISDKYEYIAVFTAENKFFMWYEGKKEPDGLYWSIDNGSLKLSYGGKEYPVQYNDGEITFFVDKIQFTFTKMREGVLPKIVDAVSMSDFEGEWVLDSIELEETRIDKIYLPAFKAEFSGFNYALKIQDGKVSLSVTYNGSSDNEVYNAVMDGNTLKVINPKGDNYYINCTDENQLRVDMSYVVFLLNKKQVSADFWICPNCGNTASGKFCNNCGTPYDSEKSSETQGKSFGTSLELKDGTYKVGEDIPAGTYSITCLEIQDYMSDYVDSLGGLVSGDYSKLLGSLGSWASALEYCYIEVVDSAGYTVKSSELYVGDNVTLVLKNGTTLQIIDGKCRFDSK